MRASPPARGLLLAAAVALLLTGCDRGRTGAAAPPASAAPDTRAFVPSPTNRDPSKAIAGIELHGYVAGYHIQAPRRVAYDQSPPFGGTHDAFWAACNGVVYPTAVRTENMVHTLEHGAVWIAYDPARISGAALAALTVRVVGRTYLTMSPYPGLDRPISLQAWGHRLKLDDPADPRIDQFITALRTNRYTTPELGASCDALGPGYFDPDHPPPFVPGPPGPDAAPPTGSVASSSPVPTS